MKKAIKQICTFVMVLLLFCTNTTTAFARGMLTVKNETIGVLADKEKEFSYAMGMSWTCSTCHEVLFEYEDWDNHSWSTGHGGGICPGIGTTKLKHDRTFLFYSVGDRVKVNALIDDDYTMKYKVNDGEEKDLIYDGSDVAYIMEPINEDMTITIMRYPKYEAKKIVLTPGDNTAVVDGKEVVTDVVPFIIGDRTYTPARFIAEALGATVNWDGETRTVTITKEDTAIVLIIDSPYAYVNGKEVELDAPAIIVFGSTFTPSRFVAEQLGAKVDWDNDNRKVIIER